MFSSYIMNKFTNGKEERRKKETVKAYNLKRRASFQRNPSIHDVVKEIQTQHKLNVKHK
jgi:hypothetical protein